MRNVRIGKASLFEVNAVGETEKGEEIMSSIFSKLHPSPPRTQCRVTSAYTSLSILHPPQCTLPLVSVIYSIYSIRFTMEN